MIAAVYLKLIGAGLAVAVLTGGYFYVKNIGKAEVQVKFDQWKADTNDAIQKAKDEKIRIETEQVKKYETAQAGYAGALDILNQRLRDLKAMSGPGNLPMAGTSDVQGSVSDPATDTSGADVRIATFPGTCSRPFYEAAMRQTLQCEALINFVRP